MNKKLVFAAMMLVAFAFILPTPSDAGGMGTALAATEICHNLVDDDADGRIDCLDSDCVPAEGHTSEATASGGPKCKPLLDDPARMVFKPDPRMDLFKVAARGILSSEIEPGSETVIFFVSNVDGTIASQAFSPGLFLPNRKGTVFKYKRKRDRVRPGVYIFVIKPKYVRKTDTNEVILKVKTEGDFSIADPLQNTAYTEEELATMNVQISIGDDAFFITAPYERKSNGWLLRDKYMTSGTPP